MGEIEKCWPTKEEGRVWMDQYLKRVNRRGVYNLDFYLASTKSQHYLKRAAYHGQNALEGNKTHKFLEKVDYLERDIMKVFLFFLYLGNIFKCFWFQESLDIQIPALPLVSTLRSLKQVVQSCFGGVVLPSFRDDLKKFRQDYRALNISVTPKVQYTFLRSFTILIF